MTDPRPRTDSDRAGPRDEERYEVLRDLGSGSVGRVELVRDTRETNGGGLFARKTVSLADEESFGLLEREYRIRTRLAHPQVPRAYALGRDPEAGTASLVLEYVHGESLDGALATLGHDAAPRLLAQGLNALSWMHQRGVLHGDLKPENLCVGGLDPGGRPLLRLLDFGTAVDQSRDEGRWRGGTLAYVAPFLRESGRPDARADLFALGRSFQEVLEEADVPPELAAILERLTQEDADFAYPSADAALEELVALDPALAAELPFPSDAPFLGREVERTALGVRLEELKSGHLRRNLVVLRGAAGMGKTRILRELERDAVLAGVEVLRLRCTPSGGVLGPVLELVSRLLPAEHEEHERLARVVAPLEPDRARAPGEWRGEISQRDLRDLAATVKAQGVHRPLVLLLDDAHLADEPTLAFLRLFARIGAAGGPLVVIAVRTEAREGEGAGAEANPALAELVAPGESGELLELDPLTPPELERLVTESLPSRAVAGAPVQEWVTWSEGNPRLALALAETLGSGEPRSEDAEPRRDALYRTLVDRRLARLHERGRRLLGALTILERPAPPAILEALWRASDPESAGHEGELVRALDPLLAQGLVEAESRWSGRRYQLVSSRLREELLGALDEESRRRLHAAALAAWEAWPFPIERPTDMLARHAIGAGEHAAALAHGHIAVHQLLRQGSLRAAESMIEALLALLEGEQVVRRCELVTSLADIHLRSGRLDAVRASIESLGDLERLAAPAERVRALRLLGSAEEAAGRYAEAIAILERGRAAIDEHTELEEQRRLLDRLGLVHYRLGEYEQARTVWELGLRAGTPSAPSAPSGGSLARSELLNDLGVLDWLDGRLMDAEERHLEALDIRRAAGDLDGESRSLTNLANVAVWRGDLAQAADFYEESLRLKRQVGTVPAQAVTLHNLANLCLKRGELGSAIASAEESIALRERVGDRTGEASSRRLLAHLYLLKGEVRRAEEELRRSRQSLEELGVEGPELADLSRAEAEQSLAGGRWAEALAWVQRGFRELGTTSNSTHRSELLRSRGEAQLGSGDVEGAVSTMTEALREARRGDDRWETGWNGLGLARAWIAAGELRSARELLVETLESVREMNTPLLLVETLLALHDLEEAEGNPEQGTSLLGEAERLSARLGLPATQLRVWLRMGRRSRRCGFATRAVLWWRKGAKTIQGLQAEYGDEDRCAFLERPEVAGIVASLKEALEEEEVSPTASVTDLIALFDVRGEPRASTGKSASLRPEILSRLLQISSAVNSMVHREEIMAYLCSRLEELFEAEDSQIVLVGRDGSFHLMGETERDSEPEISRTVLERVLREGKPVLIQDTSHDPELVDRKSVHRLGLVSILCAPLVVDGETIGIIQFSHRGKAGPFGEEDLSVLELFAHQAATALKNMLLVEQLDETIERLRSSEAKLVAGERLRALGEMSAGVAHDFNNLLTIILGITDLMRANEELPEDLVRDLETLETVSETAAATVRRLQEFRGQAHRTTQLFDPAEVVRLSAELGRRRFPAETNHEILLEIEDRPGPPRVAGHESELREVVLNLVINAIEAMPEGGRVVLRAYAESGQAVIECQDEGPGMPSDVARRVFEPFFSTKVTGQGMGLAVSWGIVRRMEGTITVETVSGGGALFRVRLPGANADVEELVPTLAAQGRRLHLRVLVVDDDPVVREVICRMLMNAGFQAVGCVSGAEALASFETEPFDLVVTDYSMPHMDGTELAARIKTLAPACPVVLLTGLSPTGLDLRTPTVSGLETSTPFDLVLRKPITSQKLAEALHLCAGEQISGP